MIDEFLNSAQSEYDSLKAHCDFIERENRALTKEIEMSKNNKGKLLSSLLGDLEENDNPLKIVKTIQILIPSKKKTSSSSGSSIVRGIKKDFDFLGLKVNETIVQSLEDTYYNTNNNLIFTERIDYIDENKKPINCILLITQSFLYMFNKVTYEKCFSVPLISLQTINASTNNNIISLTFLTGEIVIFEIFRVLEFVNFFNYMNALEKANNYSINIKLY